MSLNDATLKVYIFLKNNEGASGIEYAIVAAMVAVVLATFMPGIKEGLTDVFDSVTGALGVTTTTTPDS